MNVRSIQLSVVFLFFLLLMLFAIQTVLDVGARRTYYSHFGKVNRIVEDCPKPEIAIFGSSVSEVGIDPRVLKSSTGMTCFNYSIDGTRFIQLRGLLEEFAAHSDSCKVVILTEFLGTFTKANQLNEFQRFLAHVNKERIYSSLLNIQPDLVWKTRYIPFYKFIVMEHPYYKASALGWLNILGIRRGDPQDSLYGYTPKDISWGPNVDSSNRHSKQLVVEIDEDVVQDYKRVLESLTAKGLKVVIVIPPIQKDGREIIDGIDRFVKKMRDFEGENVHLLDLSEAEMTNNKEYFYNNSHVNSKGAALFSNLVAGKVNEILRQKSD